MATVELRRRCSRSLRDFLLWNRRLLCCDLLVFKVRYLGEQVRVIKLGSLELFCLFDRYHHTYLSGDRPTSIGSSEKIQT